MAGEEVELLMKKAALGEVEEAEQEKKWAVEVAEEEDRLLQEVAAQVLKRLVEEVVAREDRHLNVEEVAVASLQQQRSKPGRKSLLGVVEEGRQNEQVVEVVLK